MSKIKHPSREHQELLRSVGLRSTGPRIAVLQILDVAVSPLSHAEVFNRLEDTSLDRATVYRNLMDLTEAQLLTRSDHGDHIWRFERTRSATKNHVEHAHFFCIDCGSVSCLPENAVLLSKIGTTSENGGKKVVEVQVKGQCGECLVPSRQRL